MKLAEFLAEYIGEEMGTQQIDGVALIELQPIIQAGIEAFAKAERKQVSVRDIPTDYLNELYP